MLLEHPNSFPCCSVTQVLILALSDPLKSNELIAQGLVDTGSFFQYLIIFKLPIPISHIKLGDLEPSNCKLLLNE